MNVTKILDKPKQLIALTSLMREELDLLLSPFRQAWLNWYKRHGMNFKRRSKPLTSMRFLSFGTEVCRQLSSDPTSR